MVKKKTPTKKKVVKKAKAKKRSKAGQPTKYLPVFTALAQEIGMTGWTDKQIAERLHVCEATINNWKLQHPEFLESLNEGKAISDEKVVRALYERATGYSHPENKINVSEGEVIVTPTTKHYPPDATSAIFWLKNRQPDKWRDKHDYEHSGPEGGAIQTESNTDDVVRRIAFLLTEAGNKQSA